MAGVGIASYLSTVARGSAPLLEGLGLHGLLLSPPPQPRECLPWAVPDAMMNTGCRV